MKKLHLFVIGLLLFFIFTSLLQPVLSQEVDTDQQSPAHVYFLPKRPANAKLYNMVGVLASWSEGNSATSLCIKIAKDGKEQCFFAGYPFLFNGKPLRGCFNQRKLGLCEQAPKGFGFGKTRVRVTYWYIKDPLSADNSMTEITDQVDSVK
ncbi:hypothetical protein [Nostoc sp. 'Peltigera membranacea cyanobiont' 232]|uniref:hypothetical protein n=1 Tax=Nostoc sp. 'Peltigera membranacea cyanobiont' 232 TaxID=2014531 RepID=UPI000B954BB8|nr:hypothetical protein [Nostoc sp. 'Peltigera membranacea cyanobiont' 232]OYE01146.1 hypothetical protein CDG79_31130 [Nostoc sp. 'Peltigera membranacea cyanobiont' 232]